MALSASKPLDQKWALVCGASQGIGAAVAQRLAQDGASLLLLARSEDKLSQLAQRLPTKTCILAVDLKDHGAVAKGLSAHQDAHGPIHVVLLNGGGPAPGPIIKATKEEFAAAFDAHLFAAINIIQAVLPGMITSKFGRIITMLSTSVKAPLENLGVSNVTRAAMASWVKTLAREVASHGITVNNVLPGYTETDRLITLIAHAADKRHLSSEQIASEWKAKVPAARFAAPEEIAHAVAFLASPLAGYCNGINLPVDGGRLDCL